MATYLVFNRGIFLNHTRKNIVPAQKSFSTGFFSGPEKNKITHLISSHPPFSSSPLHKYPTKSFHSRFSSFHSSFKQNKRFYTMTSSPRVLTGT